MTLKERFQLSRFIRGEKASDKPITLNHRQIFILPSRQGLFFAVTLSLMLIVSLNYNLSLGFALTFLLGSLSVISIFYCFQNLAGLRFQLQPINPVFAGDAVNIHAQLSNHSRARWAITLSKKHNHGSSIKKNIAVDETAIFPLKLEGVGRGQHTVGTLTLSTLFPMGLFKGWSPFNSSQAFLVYPEPSEKLIPFDFCPYHTTQGQIVSKAGDEEFSGLTRYKAGDPLKRVDWKSMAKERGIFVKQFEETIATELLLDFEKVPGPTTEEKLSQLCRQVIEAEKNAFRYGLSLPGVFIAPAHGPKHYKATLTQLALFQS